MTNEEYTMLRSIAAANCTEGPNFDPALLTELLDTHDASEAARERLASIMLDNSIATGHGDTIDDLLGELSAHLNAETK